MITNNNISSSETWQISSNSHLISPVKLPTSKKLVVTSDLANDSDKSKPMHG